MRVTFALAYGVDVLLHPLHSLLVQKYKPIFFCWFEIHCCVTYNPQIETSPHQSENFELANKSIE